MKKTPRYATEAALCADFITWVKAEAGKRWRGIETPSWTPYAETADWDILLVGADGTQIGIQAKLRFNMKVLDQSIPDDFRAWSDTGPDYRAILIPECDATATKICGALGLMVFAPERGGWGPVGFAPGLSMEHSTGWHYWSPKRRCELPEFVPDVAAGCSAPLQLTKWKVKALRVLAALEIAGHVTRKDLKSIGIDPRPWTGSTGWLVPGEKPGEFVRGPGLDFDRQHPDVYAQVLVQECAKHEEQLGLKCQAELQQLSIGGAA
ncbi:hypothetical protein [Azohydromonas aeria]|uniref:hypothetical protein n=1 Tax=Azohydromonas aeria TaxID=2590212 RepID=UPI0012FA400C|nr:hypothetical protein [Azohydromonas aeria]